MSKHVKLPFVHLIWYKIYLISPWEHWRRFSFSLIGAQRGQTFLGRQYSKNKSMLAMELPVGKLWSFMVGLWSFMVKSGRLRSLSRPIVETTENDQTATVEQSRFWSDYRKSNFRPQTTINVGRFWAKFRL